MVDVTVEQQLVPKDVVATHVGDHHKVLLRNFWFHPLSWLGKRVGFVIAGGVGAWIMIGIRWDDCRKRLMA